MFDSFAVICHIHLTYFLAGQGGMGTMYRVAENMVDLVGYTPMVKINDIVPNKNVKVYAKLTIYT